MSRRGSRKNSGAKTPGQSNLENPMNPADLVYVSYGGADLTAPVRDRMAASGGSLSLGAGEYSTAFSDPFVNEYKDFAVVVVDRTVTPNHMRVVVAQDEEPLDVAVGGEIKDTVRPSEHPVALDIVAANYGGLDVTAGVKERWQSNGLRLSNPHEIFGDPIHGVVKAFTVSYLTSKGGLPRRAVAYWFDGEEIVIDRDNAAAEQEAARI
eukprot:PhF_6_TR4451/c0_g1_i1/m.6029